MASTKKEVGATICLKIYDNAKEVGFSNAAFVITNMERKKYFEDHTMDFYGYKAAIHAAKCDVLLDVIRIHFPHLQGHARDSYNKGVADGQKKADNQRRGGND